MSKKDSSSVSVGVRIRPRNEKEIAAGMPVYFTPSADGGAVQELDENGTVLKNWAYDNSFGLDCTNKDIFDTMVMKLVDAAMEGYNTVVFMYGQTSSGKTFTLFGGGNVVGVVQLALEHVHQRAVNSADTEYLIKLTYAELYNEEIRDLLSATPNDNLKIIDDPQLGPLIQNITEANFTTATEMKQLLDEGENRRHFGVTNMNAHSSRSHVIVRLNIESRKVPHKPAQALRSTWGKDRPNCVSTLNLVDLAGSERASKSGTSGQSLKEGSYINKSLLNLGTVISKLSEGRNSKTHVPYRDSKLTRLLATALGGNAKTCVVCCISPASGNLAESLNTLRFAARAKRVVNYVQKNEIMDAKTLANKLSVQAAEIEQLKQLLEMSKQLGFNVDDDEQGETLREQASVASKSWRNLRFVVKSGPLILSSLRSEGLTQLAKKVGDNIRDTIAGVKDVNDVVEEFSNVINTYLPKNRKLLQKMHSLAEQNEADAIVTREDLAHCSDSEDDERADFVELLQFGGDEMKEKLEQAQLSEEELRVQALHRIQALSKDLLDAANREKALRKTMDESIRTQGDQLETIRVQKLAEMALHKQVAEIQEKWRVDVAAYSDSILQLNSNIGMLQLQLTDQAEALGAKNHDILAKENDVDKLRAMVDQLTKDLSTAMASKKSLEEETSKLRKDLNVQMDRLRNNMHEMLMQGGEEAKVLQNQNLDLMKELDIVRDAMNEAIKMKSNQEVELSHIRAELTLRVSEEKLRQEEMTILRDEGANLSNKLREMRLEVTKLTSALSFSEAHNQQLQTEVSVATKTRDDMLDTKDKEMELQRERLRAKLAEMQLVMDCKDNELTSALEQIQAKQLHLQKVEQSISSDVSRLEKKLEGQIKRNEELKKENTSVSLSLHAMQFKHQDEVKALKVKIGDLQGMLDSINNYVGQQEKELLDNPEYDYYDPITFDSSPMFRPGSMRFRRTNSDADFSSPMSEYGGSFYRKDSEYTLRSSFRDAPDSNGSKPSQRHNSGTPSEVEFDYPYVEEIDISLPSEKKAKPERHVRMQSSPQTYRSRSSSDDEEEDSNLADFRKQSAQLGEYTSQLLYGLQLATVWLEYCLKEGTLIRCAAVKQKHSLLDQQLRDQATILKLQNVEDYLSESGKQTRLSLEHAEQRVSVLEAHCNQLEQAQQAMQKDLFKVTRSEKVSTAHAGRFEQLYLDCKVQLDKIKLDVQIQRQGGSNLRAENLQLQGQVQIAEEKQRTLEDRLDLAKQQVDILSEEKQALMERLMAGYSHSPGKRFTTQAQQLHASHAYASKA